MNRTEEQIFDLLKASIFTHAAVEIEDWVPVFSEMKEQTVATLPGEWLKTHLPSAKSWALFCSIHQGHWIQIMYRQSELIHLLETNNIPCVVIKGAAAAMNYPHPTLRTMGDVDILVKRKDLEQTADLLEANGYILAHDKNTFGYHYTYSKHKIIFELHRRLPIIPETDEKLLNLFEKGIDERIWHEMENFSFPTLPTLLNGLVLIFHINQHLREGLGLRQIIDWMMYVNSLSEVETSALLPLLKSTGMEKLALSTTAMCQRYLGFQKTLPGCESVNFKVCSELMSVIMEHGNFGMKTELDGKIAAFSLSSTETGGFFKRLQEGGLIRWKAAKKHKILQPFAFIYQSFHILRVLINNRVNLREIHKQSKKGIEHRKLIEALGLQVDTTIQPH